ncbi:MAG: hypothetical protein ACRDAM_12065, partial [Casimicrobium sp.]
MMFVLSIGVFIGVSVAMPKARSALILGTYVAVAFAGAIGLIAVESDRFLTLPGRAFYEPLVAYLNGAKLGVSTLQVSLDSARTLESLLVLSTAIAILVVVPYLTREQVMALLGAYAALVVFQAAIGLLQLALNSPSFLAFGAAVGGKRAAGTFVNKNHFATFLAMALPLLLMRSIGRFTFIGS